MSTANGRVSAGQRTCEIKKRPHIYLQNRLNNDKEPERELIHMLLVFWTRAYTSETVSNHNESSEWLKQTMVQL